MAYQIDLDGRVALVTGGTRGIGLAVARTLAEAGAGVLIASRKSAAVDEAVEGLRADGLEVAGATANVGDADDRTRLIAKCVERFGRLDILVNNAAANPAYGPVEDTDPGAYAKIMQVNLEAPFELARLALPHLTSAAPGHVVNVSSIGGISPEPGLGIYSVSKTALNGLTRVLAREWASRGVQVNAVCPGLIKTDFSRALWDDPDTLRRAERRTPMGRIGQPAEIAQLILAIVGGPGSYATGQIFTADGGYTL